MEKQLVRIGDHHLAYYQRGEGEPVLLVHGITTYSFLWRDVTPHLGDDLSVYAIDLIGCGDSEKPTGVDYSIKAQAELIRLFIKALGLDRVHLVCHDIGGGIGQIMAVRNPEVVKSLTLINTVGYDYWPVQPIITLRVPFLRELAMAVMDKGVFKGIIRRGLYHKDKLDRELLELFMRPLRTKEGRQGFLHLARCLNNGDLMEIEEDLKRINLPVMIIRGDADPYLSPRISERLYRDIPGAVLKRVKTAGHFIQIDEPELLGTLIREFITGVRYGEETSG